MNRIPKQTCLSDLPTHSSHLNILNYILEKCIDFNVASTTHSFIGAISIAPLQVLYYSEALPIQHGYFVGILLKRHRQL